MKLEDELTSFLFSTSHKSANIARDAEIVAFYYGFRDAVWPTYREAAAYFDVGTRERVRQIINKLFRGKIALEALPSLETCAEIIQEYDCVAASDLLVRLEEEDLLETTCSVKGLLNLLHFMGLCTEYEPYSPGMRKVTRRNISLLNDYFLVKKSELKSLKSQVRLVRTLPGQLGIANFRYVDEHFSGLSEARLSSLKQTIIKSRNSCVIYDNNETWYIFEDKDNTLINQLRKAFFISNTLPSEILAATMANALTYRSHRYAYPSEAIIDKYLRKSRVLTLSAKGFNLIGEPGALNAIDEDIVTYVSENKGCSFPELRRYLSSRGHSRSHIVKVAFAAPYLFIDKSLGRHNYSFHLVNEFDAHSGSTNIDPSRYELFKARLRSLESEGSDIPRQVLARREQGILREWLFDGQDRCQCAICGAEFEPRALIAAHKKPRNICSESERLDPYIVMPLCKFGCEYLYDNEFIFIFDGKVTANRSKNSSGRTSERILELSERDVESIWLEGDESYFYLPSDIIE